MIEQNNFFKFKQKDKMEFIKDSWTCQNEEGETLTFNYHILIRNKKVEKVYNTAFGDWGHSINKNSEVFEYFATKHNGK